MNDVEKFSQCFYCGGYYTRCFGDPICRICHAFIYPHGIDQQQESNGCEDKGEADDSGNEDTDDGFACASGTNKQAKRTSTTSTDSSIQSANNSVISLISNNRRNDLLNELLLELTVPNSIWNDHASYLSQLPPEVMLAIMKCMDDLSIYALAKASNRWSQLIDSTVDWKQFIRTRWPLFPLSDDDNSLNLSRIYDQLIRSSSCFTCLSDTGIRFENNRQMQPTLWRHRRLQSEIRALRDDPPDGIRAEPLDSSCCHWHASIWGPSSSPYEGGIFYLYLHIPQSYPMIPPIVRFITKIFHPNINIHGDIGLDSFGSNWSLALTISKVLISVQSLLSDPYAHICMNRQAADLYMNDREQYEQKARQWTWTYAMHDYINGDEIEIEL
ncbi:unnamed protein product [Rotaria magnacalcarata]|uniref:E2 ubiquitin-conjugating enzyme n=1 Tax=Rotaria magnacalcarata TaxID=392030 RepID=A0A816U0K7_9BILA|nr:unnamed protein product [Rotaria magnacalcarata]CAF1387188.1 unnamed protein product [Rotaria magnacalcarata]CAF2106142.1 unnamed protein product [Rotaria magnacalcarata]CAF2115820.1 unnamed protein product [Rotaria magnacalcarata]CAF2245264.1 unnamed protein product [Rotaria magnacalcarata]